MNFIKMTGQYVIRSVITLILAMTFFVTNLFWPAASQAIAQALPVQANPPQSNPSWLTGILQLALANIPSNLKYTKDHEWVLVQGNIATVGITEYAQRQLGEIVLADLPKVGASFNSEDEIGTLEAVKAVSEVYAPVSGKVVEVNQELYDSPENINADPYGDGWLVKIELSNSSELKALLSDQEYKPYTEEAV